MREGLLSCLAASVQHIGSGEYEHQEATTRIDQLATSRGRQLGNVVSGWCIGTLN